ncbi:MAG: DUF1761 domain-containing protein [Proteobacteria bacterium]|nr:DUF1761 domain-containing protein [Pseudomonadota bacterium]MDA0928375.1 DUF1761 domain-containing protein [Pseudomonadota bacterium]
MDPATATAAINWLSVIIAAVSAFMVGGLWYGPLFGKAWAEGFGLSDEYLASRNMPMVFGVSLLLSFIAAINLEMFIGAEATLAFGVFAGFTAGFGWVAAFLGILYLFEKRTLKVFLINGGYCVVALTTMGAILGVM